MDANKYSKTVRLFLPPFSSLSPQQTDRMLSPSTTTLVLLLASSLLFPSQASAQTDTPGIFSIPINYTLGADAKFVATIAVGSQGTEMQIVMDLGSEISWLYGPNELVWGNGSNNGPYNCVLEWTPFYSPNASTTANVTTARSLYASYGGGAKVVTGSTFVVDTLATGSGDSALLPFYAASLTTVREIDTLACLKVPADYDGIFGLTTPTNLAVAENTSFRYSMQHPPAPQAPLIDSATLAVFLRNATTTPALQPMAGEVLLGGIDTSAFVGPLVSIANATVDSHYGLYYLPLPRLSVAGVSVSLDADQADACLVDSGTVGDVWPVSLFSPTYQYKPEVFLAQAGLLALTAANGNSVWAYPSACADIPANATFDFAWASPSGQDITIQVPIRNYARSAAEVNDDSCALDLDVIGCVLGASFLSAAYFMVDDDAGVVALAQAGEGVGGRVAIKSGEGIPGLVV